MFNTWAIANVFILRLSWRCWFFSIALGLSLYLKKFRAEKNLEIPMFRRNKTVVKITNFIAISLYRSIGHKKTNIFFRLILISGFYKNKYLKRI